MRKTKVKFEENFTKYGKFGKDINIYEIKASTAHKNNENKIELNQLKLFTPEENIRITCNTAINTFEVFGREIFNPCNTRMSSNHKTPS